MSGQGKTYHVLVFFLLFLIAGSLTVYGQRTTRKGLRPLEREQRASSQEVGDTLEGEVARMLLVTGFDKPLRSAYESMFVTNRLESQVSGVVFSVEYYDMRGRKLHSRQLTVNVDIPPGETRQLTFRTWDRQQSFYYHRSSKPRRADATPFDVVVRIEKVIIPLMK